MSEPRELLEVAVRVAHEAGKLLLAGQDGGVEVRSTKSSPTDVVTAVDIAAEELIRSRIAVLRPGDGFVGEEGADQLTTTGVTWVIDPIDGTVNYLYGIPQYSVSIAARTETGVVAGAVHNPVSGETFTAKLGGGALLNGAPVAVTSPHSVAAALVATGFGYQAETRVRQAAETARLLPQVRDIRRFGSAALDLCAVACGRVDAYVERGLKPWDLAAGGLIAAEAGAVVQGMNGAEAGEALVIAASRAIFDGFHALLLDCGYGTPL